VALDRGVTRRMVEVQMPLRSIRLVLFATAALLLTPSAASAAWTVSPTPNVAGADTYLSAVDCSSANSCMAVGYAVFQASGSEPSRETTVAERWNGTSWQMVPTPGPPNATTPISLAGVSCPRPDVCFAVGSTGGGTSSTPLIELWNGTSWSHQPSPGVGHGALHAVSCSGLRACTAVGVAVRPGGVEEQTLAERWDGTRWRVQSTPVVAGSVFSGLFGVSCPLKRTCTAVGGSTAAASPFSSSPLVERWDGRINAWGLQAAPKPAGAEDAGFSGVSCPHGPVCFAVGRSVRTIPFVGTPNLTLAERRVGSSWSVMPTPNQTPPPQVIVNSELVGVSCPGRRACHAVGDGYGVDPSGTAAFRAIAEGFDGASWQLESTPSNDGDTRLTGVSCPSRVFCMAVGGTGESPVRTLAAKWTP
jgi:hypothetical protein